MQQFKDNYGEIYEETQININPANGISEVTHLSDGEVDAEGVIVGKPTLDKLDRFLDLANASYSPQDSDHIINLPGTDHGLQDEHHTQASAVLDNLNIRLTDTVADELDNWFAEAEAIRLQAYRWNTADKSLKNLWLYGGDNTRMRAAAAHGMRSIRCRDSIPPQAYPQSRPSPSRITSSASPMSISGSTTVPSCTAMLSIMAMTAIRNGGVMEASPPLTGQAATSTRWS
jgi:hypothetical protein